MTYHNSVLLKECIEGLKINPNGIYLDVTFGGGGHSKEILKNLDKGRLYAFDRDCDAQKNVLSDEKFKLIHANYKNIKRFMRLEGVRKVNGILADLGVSSHQFDVAERGFSFRFDAELDMRMNTSSSLTARQVINNYSEAELTDIFYQYGELRQSRKIAELIIEGRGKKKIHTTNDLISLVENLVSGKRKNQFLFSR